MGAATGFRWIVRTFQCSDGFTQPVTVVLQAVNDLCEVHAKSGAAYRIAAHSHFMKEMNLMGWDFDSWWFAGVALNNW
jgi:hypothetical protein